KSSNSPRREEGVGWKREDEWAWPQPLPLLIPLYRCLHWREGRKGSLSVNEFKELVTQQLPHLLKDVGSLDEKMKSLDVNQDSELKFSEYWRLIGELAKEMRKEKALEIRKK
uniref:S100 calcium binding protein A13 n=1 Tax=Ovis aries TaxID=9940 RepID=A0AC11DT57_SHEEP